MTHPDSRDLRTQEVGVLDRGSAPPYHQKPVLEPEDLGGKLGLTRCTVVMARLADFLAYPSLRPYACKAFQSSACRDGR